MDTKYKSHSFVKLWIATTIFILCCFTTDMSAQNAAAADTVAAVTETITEVVAAPAEEASAAPDTVGELALGLNTVWMLLAAMLVFFMQPGFALVEAGFTRVKNTANILMKNFVDFMFGSLLYWFIGFGLMFGAGGFIGMPHFFDLSFIDNGLPTKDLIFLNRFCCDSSYNCIRSHGRTHKILHVYRLHHLYQCTDLSDIRSLDMGRRLVDER